MYCCRTDPLIYEIWHLAFAKMPISLLLPLGEKRSAVGGADLQTTGWIR